MGNIHRLWKKKKELGIPTIVTDKWNRHNSQFIRRTATRRCSTPTRDLHFVSVFKLHAKFGQFCGSGPKLQMGNVNTFFEKRLNKCVTKTYPVADVKGSLVFNIHPSYLLVLELCLSSSMILVISKTLPSGLFSTLKAPARTTTSSAA